MSYAYATLYSGMTLSALLSAMKFKPANSRWSLGSWTTLLLDRWRPLRHPDSRATCRRSLIILSTRSRGVSRVPQYQGALKRTLDEPTLRDIWKTLEQPEGKAVLGARIIFKRKIGKAGQVTKQKYHFVAKGFRCAPIPGILIADIATQWWSVRMALVLMALTDWEG